MDKQKYTTKKLLKKGEHSIFKLIGAFSKRFPNLFTPRGMMSIMCLIFIIVLSILLIAIFLEMA